MRASTWGLALVLALAMAAAFTQARIRREFGSVTAPVRMYTAKGQFPADSQDCFVGTCPQDITMPFMFGDVCDNVKQLAAGTPVEFGTQVGQTTVHLAALFYEFFINQNCPASFQNIFGAQWEAYTAEMGSPVEFNFIEYGVSPSGPHRQCPNLPSSICSAYPNGVVRMNFVFDNFCQSTCVIDVSPSPSASPPGPGNTPQPPTSPVVTSPGLNSPVTSPGVSSSILPSPPPLGQGLGPVPQSGAQISPQPFELNFPNPPYIIFGSKDVLSAGASLHASFMLTMLAVLLAAVALRQ